MFWRSEVKIQSHDGHHCEMLDALGWYAKRLLRFYLSVYWLSVDLMFIVALTSLQSYRDFEAGDTNRLAIASYMSIHVTSSEHIHLFYERRGDIVFAYQI